MSAASLNSVYRKILSTGTGSASQHYPPNIFEEHFNIVTNFILDECARLFPTNQSIVDVIRPFLSVKFAKLNGNTLPFPSDYRNFLGAAINLDDKTKSPCGCDGNGKVYMDDPLAPTKKELEKKINSLGCSATDITILDIDEFNYYSSHPYKKPRLVKPIGAIFGGEGLKICPADVAYAEMYYIRKAKTYQMGYTTNPDDTLLYDDKTTEESEWDDTGLQYLIKGVTGLYAIYTTNSELRDWNVELKKIGLF